MDGDPWRLLLLVDLRGGDGEKFSAVLRPGPTVGSHDEGSGALGTHLSLGPQVTCRPQARGLRGPWGEAEICLSSLSRPRGPPQGSLLVEQGF